MNKIGELFAKPIDRKIEEVINELVHLYAEGQFDAISQRVPALLETHPSSVVLWNIRGAVLRALGDISGAARAFQHVTELNPKYPDGHNNFGLALQEPDRHERCHHQSAVICPPPVPELRPGKTVSLRGVA